METIQACLAFVFGVENKLPEYSVKTDSELCLPPRATNDDIAVEYLTKKDA